MTKFCGKIGTLVIPRQSHLTHLKNDAAACSRYICPEETDADRKPKRKKLNEWGVYEDRNKIVRIRHRFYRNCCCTCQKTAPTLRLLFQAGPYQNVRYILGPPLENWWLNVPQLPVLWEKNQNTLSRMYAFIFKAPVQNTLKNVAVIL